MAKTKFWSIDEDRVLFDQVVRNAKLTNAFEATSKLLERTPRACSSRWYALQKSEHYANLINEHKAFRVEEEPKVTFKSKLLNFLKRIFF